MNLARNKGKTCPTEYGFWQSQNRKRVKTGVGKLKKPAKSYRDWLV